MRKANLCAFVVFVLALLCVATKSARSQSVKGPVPGVIKSGSAKSIANGRVIAVKKGDAPSTEAGKGLVYVITNVCADHYVHVIAGSLRLTVAADGADGAENSGVACRTFSPGIAVPEGTDVECVSVEANTDTECVVTGIVTPKTTLP